MTQLLGDHTGGLLGRRQRRGQRMAQQMRMRGDPSGFC